MATLAEQYIRPFLPGARMVQAKVSFTQLSELIVERQKVVQEERLAARIEACKIKVSQLVEAHASTCKLTPQVYALVLLSEKCDCRDLINSIITNINIDHLSNSVSELVFTEMEDYFGTSISRQEQFAISIQELLPPHYIHQVLQEYVNTLRVTKVMGQAVNKVCHEGLSQIDLPLLIKKLINKIEFGSILMGAFDCHPEEQRKRLYQQTISCISGMIHHIKVRIKKQFYEELMQTFYQFYDEHSKQDLKLLSISRQQRSKKKWIKYQKQDYMYKVKEAV